MIMTVLIDTNGISELHRKLIPIQDEFFQSGPSENCFPWCMVSYERYTKNNLGNFELKNMFSLHAPLHPSADCVIPEQWI